MLIAWAVETKLFCHIMGIREHGGKEGWFTLGSNNEETHGATI